MRVAANTSQILYHQSALGGGGRSVHVGGALRPSASPRDVLLGVRSSVWLGPQFHPLLCSWLELGEPNAPASPLPTTEALTGRARSQNPGAAGSARPAPC